jgi:hypothetical protein
MSFVPARFDAMYGQWQFDIAGEEYVFDTRRLPFRIVDAKIDGKIMPAAAEREVLDNAHKQVRNRYL